MTLKPFYKRAKKEKKMIKLEKTLDIINKVLYRFNGDKEQSFNPEKISMVINKYLGSTFGEGLQKDLLSLTDRELEKIFRMPALSVRAELLMSDEEALNIRSKRIKNQIWGRPQTDI